MLMKIEGVIKNGQSTETGNKWDLLQINHIYYSYHEMSQKKPSKTTCQLTDVFRSTLCYSQVFAIFSVTFYSL
jgi:hypothetical protein